MQIPQGLLRRLRLHTDDELAAHTLDAARDAASQAAAHTLNQILLANPTLVPHLERYSGGSDIYGYDPLDQDFRKYMDSTGHFPLLSACDQAIAAASADLPLCVYSQRGRGEPEKLTDHPLLDLFDDPNPEQGFAQWWTEGTLNRERTGNVYLVAVSDRFPKFPFLAPDELWFANSGLMKPQFSNAVRRGRTTKVVVGYTYDDGAATYTPDEVMHIKRPNPRDPAVGLSSYKELETVLNLWFRTMQEANNYMRNGSKPGLVFQQVQGGMNQGGPQAADAVDRFRDQIERGTAGVRNAGRNLYLSPFWKIIEKAGDSAKDATYIESLEFLNDMILAAKGVPPFAVGLPESSNWGDSKNEQKRWFYNRTVMPGNQMFLDAMNTHDLVRSFAADGETLWLEFDYSGVESLQEDVNALWARVSNAWNLGITSRNEARSFLGLEPIDGPLGDEIRVSPFVEVQRMIQAGDGNDPGVDPPATLSGPAELLLARKLANDAPTQMAANDILWDGAEERKRPIRRAYERRFRPLLRALWIEVESNMRTASADLHLADNSADDNLVPRSWIERQWFRLGTILQEWIDEARDLAEEAVRTGAQDAAVAVTGEAHPIDMESEALQAVIRERSGIGIKQMLDTQEAAIRKAAQDAVEKGETIGQLTKKVRAIGRGREKWWAERIARTETQPLYNTGFLANAKDLGATSKTWLAARGGNRRPNHQAMDDQTVDIDGDFIDEIMGSSGPSPGMMSGGAKNNANCACAANVGSVIR